MGYLPLRISTVRPNEALTFDLYIFFKNTYLCYQEKGAEIGNEKLEKLKVQDVASFYITEEDVDNYQIFMDQKLKEVLNDDSISVEEKVEVTEGVASSALENFQMNPETEKSYNMTKKAAAGLRSVIENNPSALKALFGKKSKESDRIIQHSLNVCGLSTKLAQLYKCREEELEDLATASLIHDIGLVRFNKEDRALFMKSKKEFTPGDHRVYGYHCKDSAKMFEDKPYVNKRVQELVENHHENRQGTGPNKKKVLTKLEEILSLVNRYDKIIITEELSPTAALKALQVDEIGNYDLDMINNFKQVLKTEGILD